MSEEIRPDYYQRAGSLCEPVLRALGYSDRLLVMECRLAWAEKRHNLCGELTHAVKYLWRAGKKRDAKEDLIKARFWLIKARGATKATIVQVSFFLPMVEDFDKALDLLEQIIQEYS